MLTLTDLRLLRGRTLVLDGFSAHLPAKAGAWLMGANGAGKSSLLRAAAGLLTPLSGTLTRPDTFIYVGAAHGHDQNLCVLDNLAFWAGINGVAGVDLAAVLKAAGLADLAYKRTGDLSAGQQQRLALARLVVKPTKLWLLDEPTSTLDTDGQQWLAGLIRQQLENSGSVLCATHAPIAGLPFETWALKAPMQVVAA